LKPDQSGFKKTLIKRITAPSSGYPFFLEREVTDTVITVTDTVITVTDTLIDTFFD